MFSDPLDSSSSDTRSFDDDDMYGSDSGVETISLKHDLKEKARDNKETMVCTCPTMYIRAILHLRQEDGLIPTFARMEVIMNDIAIMVNALCEAEGIDATSIPSHAQINHLVSLCLTLHWICHHIWRGAIMGRVAELCM
jgi:hypothetical protein